MKRTNSLIEVYFINYSAQVQEQQVLVIQGGGIELALCDLSLYKKC